MTAFAAIMVVSGKPDSGTATPSAAPGHLVPSQARIGERGVLTGRGLVDSFFEGVFRRPLFGRARFGIPIHFVEPPEDFEGMAVGVARDSLWRERPRRWSGPRTRDDATHAAWRFLRPGPPDRGRDGRR